MLRKIIPILFIVLSSTIYAQTPTTVTISSNKTYITEDESLNITATLNAISSSDVTVNFTFTGTATAEVDYTTMAGPFTVAGVTNSSGLTADKLKLPIGICVDAAGNIYIADQSNHRIQKWVSGASVGITVAGESGVSGSDASHLNNPSDVFVDAAGNIYIADQDNHRIQKWASGESSGSTVAGLSGVAGTTLDKLDSPHGVYVDASGNIYISDYNNHRVQEWVLGAGIGATVAGGTQGNAANQLNNPFGLFVDGSGTIYIADASNHRVQKWTSGATEGITVAGDSNGVLGSTANKLNTPFDVFVDAFGSVYVADAINQRIQKWTSGATEGITVAGGNGLGTSMDQFHYPSGVWVDNLGKIYAVDYGNHRVQQNQYSPIIVIEAGQISESLQVDGIVDVVSEGDETIIVDVASVVNATLVEPSQLNLTILCADAPVGDPTQTFCNSAQVSDLAATGTDIKWYATSSGGSALVSTVALVDGTSYFATQTLDGCESSLRFEVVVTINQPAAPAGDATQSFIDSGTVADLEATGSNIQWYAASSGGSVLGSTTALVDGSSYFATQTVSTCESASRFEVAVTIIPYTTNTWTGAAGNDWGNSANWSSAVVPDASHNVVIPIGEFPEYSGSGSCHNLTIAVGGGLTLSGTITVGGNVTIESDVSSSGSLIYSGSGAIVSSAKSTSAAPASITFERYLTNGEWHMMGSPLNGQTINSTFLSSNSISGMKDYLEGTDTWSSDYSSTAPNVSFSLGKGYATKRSSADVVSLTGTPNSAQIDIALTRGNNGWNLLSNPFTSAIAANNTGDGTNNLITVNTGVLDPSYVGLYIWNQTTTSYLIVNHSGGTLNQNYLQACQGFFVRSSNPASGTFSITPAMQSHQANVAFKSSEEEAWSSIILNLESSDVSANTKISYHERMSRGLDIGYDAGMFGANPNLSIYSRLVEDNGVDFGLQCLPLDYENLVVPLGVKAVANDILSFSVSATNIPEEYAIILEDRVLGKFIDLSDENEKYTIQLSDDLNGLGRFFLHTSFKDALGLDDLNSESNVQVFSRASQNQIVICGEVSSNAIARIYSVSGKMIKTVRLSQEIENSLSFNKETGVYIIQIMDSKKTITRKLSWVKQ